MIISPMHIWVPLYTYVVPIKLFIISHMDLLGSYNGEYNKLLNILRAIVYRLSIIIR